MKNFDIIVIGGGVAGCGAAISGARCGARVLLAERHGFLGGCSTASLVSPFMSHKTSDGKVLVEGIFAELTHRLRDRDGMLANAFDSEIMKEVLADFVAESGAELLLRAHLTDVRDGYTVTFNGNTTIKAKFLIDCTGNASAAAMLGAEFLPAKEYQSVTLMFDMAGVDEERVLAYAKTCPDNFLYPKMTDFDDPAEMSRGIYTVAGFFDRVAAAKAAGEYHVPGDMIFFIPRPRRGEVCFNTTHASVSDPNDPFELTRAERETRKQAREIESFVRKYVPGFENAYIARIADEVGVRESRRILGEYVLTEEDVVTGRKFDDCVCRSAYPIDVHTMDGYIKDGIMSSAPPAGDWYEIPLRCLMPRGMKNILVAGKCLSATRPAQGSARIMPNCIAMGEAAGLYAAEKTR